MMKAEIASEMMRSRTQTVTTARPRAGLGLGEGVGAIGGDWFWGVELIGLSVQRQVHADSSQLPLWDTPAADLKVQ